ncbi:DEAD/DEAH box helicase [Clostridium estertheticum]|uniref:DEAD/DEAH box helicase n=1 Tax=Clostridium estertheticum TaxID=238834 RepID=UPI001CF4631C|nr:DEAD/DEAH box helicase [Clostridium estertheticum]MCB2361088.1 DEAD/DEAH box helicase [Clostridium estertheticum]
MLKYSANYAYTNNNFVIQNIIINNNNINKNRKYYSIICIMKNLLQRGTPTNMSKFLQSKLGVMDLDNDREKMYLINREKPNWVNTIKGDVENNYIPAKFFYENQILKYMGKYSFIQQLILPEIKISAIVGKEQKEFVDEQVDFYLPQAKLVIEIDGEYHKEVITKKNDEARDKYLLANGIVTIRINTIELEKENDDFISKMNLIIRRCDEYRDLLKLYEEYFTMPSKYKRKQEWNVKLKATAIIRFQLTILSLLEANILSLEDEHWNIEIIQRDVDDFAEIAIDDLFLWIKNLCKLMKMEFNKPKLNIIYCNTYNDFHYKNKIIHIDFSLLKRWTDENENYKEIIFVRTDYIDDADYFKVSTADPIRYNIIQDGDDSDVPCLEFLLKNIFGYDNFSNGQLPIITNILRGNDTIGLLPTGAGKSLCYQFSALLQPCISFVVTPIKSLMIDQKENLDRKFVTRTEVINSDQDAEKKQAIAKKFSQGKYFFIWISPERFQIKEFRKYLTVLNENQSIALAVIDEVHCLSEWGHDFRTSYLNLCKTIRRFCPSINLLGLTATASINVLKDILIEFESERENVKTILEYTRPELLFKIYRDSGQNSEDKYKSLESLLNMFDKKSAFEVNDEKTKSGLIFTVNKNGPMGCYGLHKKVWQKFPEVARWYSGEVPEETRYENGQRIKTTVMEKEEFNSYKQKVQSEYKDNKYPLLIATKAFGMGIDKSNIRYTIHYGIPGSIESLYQEAGRAGRDKGKAICYIFYTSEILDRKKMDKLFQLDTTIEEIKEIGESVGYKDGRDVMRNFFLWIQNNKGVNVEVEFTYRLFEKYAEPDKVKIINCSDVLSSFKSKEINGGNVFSLTQKAIYRLSLLGIVEDWTIEKWNKNGSYEVNFLPYNEDTVEKALATYIGKYDSENEVLKEENAKLSNSRDKEEHGMNGYQKSIKLLIQWNYDNVFYHRRQSLKTLVDLCENYEVGKEENFKRTLEGYFKFNESTYVLEHISENPREYKKWFEVFRKENGDLIDKNDIESLKVSISRYLESFRFNTGLNYISGMIRLVVNDFDNTDGRDRLNSAFEKINGLSEEDKKDILDNSLEIAKLLDNKNKYFLSETLCRYYKNDIANIYKSLEDNNSLNLVIKDSVKRLEKVGGKFL